jgi:hypothetical protein
VEGNDIFKGTTDIVVCDGFVGNVTLKASKAWALRQDGADDRIQAQPADDARRPDCERAAPPSQPLNPSRYNGASLLGLRGLVFKSHGGADAYSFEWAIKRAFDAAKQCAAQLSTMIAELMPRNHGPCRKCRLSTNIGCMTLYSKIIGTGSYLPSKRVTNQELTAQLAAKGIETSDEWIVSRSGISARHYAAPTEFVRPGVKAAAARAGDGRPDGQTIST